MPQIVSRAYASAIRSALQYGTNAGTNRVVDSLAQKRNQGKIIAIIGNVSSILRKDRMVSDELASKSRPRDFGAAQREVAELRKQGKLSEAQLVEFAKSSRYEQTVAALELLCRVPIDVIERLMAGDRPDPILILCKAAGWGWPTARAVIQSRPHVATSSHALDNAFSNFERLSPATAQRVMRFWQARTTAVPEIRYT
jgi:hypothetical protein